MGSQPSQTWPWDRRPEQPEAARRLKPTQARILVQAMQVMSSKAGVQSRKQPKNKWSVQVKEPGLNGWKISIFVRTITLQREKS